MYMKTVDREISWVNFNYRVLHQAMREDVPLLERVKFLGISFSNLNEFIAVRFSSVLEGFLSDSKEPDDCGRTNWGKKYNGLLTALMEFKRNQYGVYNDIMGELKSKIGVRMYDNYKDLNDRDSKTMKKYFEEEVLPVLTPVTYDSTKEVPIMEDEELQFLIKVTDHNETSIIMMTVPSMLDRIVKIADKRFIFLEEIIRQNLQSLFVGMKIEDYIIFKTYKFVTDSLSSDADKFIIDRMKKYLTDRDFTNNNVFLDIRTKNKHTDLVKVLYKIMDVYKKHVFITHHPLLLNCLCGDFYKNPKYEYDEFKPQIPADFIGEDGIMKRLDKEDILIQHPYESFDLVVDFLNEAAGDPKVMSIKQTLYRVSSEDSPLIRALCKAARNGKKVIVMLEIKARFDERQNIALIETLKDAGCTLIYGLEKLKVHCKMCLVTKKCKSGIKIFSHVGTGNYNDKTARVYTDISFMTSSDKLGNELNAVFNMISGLSWPKGLKNTYFSPFGIREKLFDLIDREVKHVKNGKKGKVIFKMNSLCDYKTIKKIYDAADKGVKFEIICRGICSLVPRKNITVKSIVGRFLEHSRIYWFYNNDDAEIFISSADLMTRNLEKRVELMIPIKDSGCRKKLLNVLEIYCKDEFNSYIMTEDKKYNKLKGEINSHKIFIKRSDVQYKIPKKMRS